MLRERRRSQRKLERSGRITPREVLEAYRDTGLAPMFGEWYALQNGKERACALTAVGIAQGHRCDAFGLEVGRAADALMDSRFGPYEAHDYQDAFVYGFDGHDLPPSLPPDDSLGEDRQAWERIGWRDGRRARRAVFGEAS
jgi:hypothetical protein